MPAARQFAKGGPRTPRHAWSVGAWAALSAALCVSAPAARAATCDAPAELRAAVRTHPTPSAYTALGNWFGDGNKYNCAADAFRSALKLSPDSAPLSYMLGLTLYAGGQTDQAVPPLEQAIRLDPRLLKAHLLLAAADERLGRRPQARAEWESALRIDPTSPIALDGISKSLIADGDYSSVTENIKPAPHDENLTLDLALAYAKMNMLEESAATLSEALKVNPSSTRLTKAMVTVMVQQTRYQEAAQLAERTARRHPDDLDAQADYLRVLVLNGDAATARPLARKLLAAAPHNFDFLYLSGILERQAGEFDAARSHLTEAVSLNPGYYNSHYNLGAVLSKLHDPKGARAEFEKAIELGATEPEVRFDLAGVLRTLGETALAQQQLKIYQQLLKDQASRTLAAGKAAQAVQALAAGDPAKAAALYREAFEATPQNAPLGYKLALALDKAGDTAAERATLEQVVKLDPSMALAQNQLGYIESSSGDPASAETHFKMALRAAPAYVPAWVSLAATLGMESRFSEAQEALASALRLDPDNAQAHELAKALTAAQAQAKR